MKRKSLFFLILFSFVLIVILSTYFLFNRKSQSTFLKGAISSISIYHNLDEKNSKTITNYKELSEVINYIDSINYIEEPKMTMIMGGETYTIKIFREDKKYSKEYLIFYHNHIHYICVNDVSNKESNNILVNIWYEGNEDMFNTVKNFYEKAKK